MKRPLYSICIPLFNHENYIGRTIQSVLDQDFNDFEIIIADNASTDNSKEIVKSFNDPRIKLIENRYNIGFAPNLQQVTRFAKGKFINLLSSDDLMEQGTLSTYNNIIQQFSQYNEKLVLMSDAWQIDCNDKKNEYITKKPGHFFPYRISLSDAKTLKKDPLYEVFDGFEIFKKSMEDLNTAGTFCTVVYSRCLWESVEGYNSTQLINPDMHFIHKITRLKPKVIYVNNPLYSYRRHSLGQGAQQTKNKVLAK